MHEGHLAPMPPPYPVDLNHFALSAIQIAPLRFFRQNYSLATRFSCYRWIVCFWYHTFAFLLFANMIMIKHETWCKFAFAIIDRFGNYHTTIFLIFFLSSWHASRREPCWNTGIIIAMQIFSTISDSVQEALIYVQNLKMKIWLTVCKPKKQQQGL